MSATGTRRSTTASTRKPFGVYLMQCSSCQVLSSVHSLPVSFQRFRWKKLPPCVHLLLLACQQSMHVNICACLICTCTSLISQLDTFEMAVTADDISVTTLCSVQAVWTSMNKEINQSINLYRAIVQRHVLQCGYAESKRNVLKTDLKCVNGWSSSTVQWKRVPEFRSSNIEEQAFIVKMPKLP